MNARTILFLVLPVAACSSQTPSANPLPGAAGAAGSNVSAGGSTASAGSSPGGSASGGAASAGTGNGLAGSDSTATGGTGGSSTSGGGTGGVLGSSGAASAGAAGAGSVPPGYTGTPFKALTIPGFIYAADYDKGGAGVGYCRVGAAMPPTAASCMTAKIDDWCCGTKKGCDERTQPAVCPIYRMDNDNAGLSHMNTGEPDNYSITGPTWVAGANGPTLTGPMVTAGSPVLQHANTTTVDDAYLSYLYTGQWQKYTVQVAAPGTYAIGGLLASPGATMTLDFVSSTATVTSVVQIPVSPTANCNCPETYHSWTNMSNIGTVTFAAAGTYVMKFTLTTSQFNPLFFTFTKM